jgi:hypothetical protein
VTPSGGSVNATSIAQAVWSYSPRSLTDIQSLVSAIQNNDPSLLSTLSDLMYVPAPYFVGQVSATQVAAFIDNVVRNYGLVVTVAAFMVNNPYNLWTTNFVSSLAANPYLTNTSLNMLLSNVYMPANYAQLLLYYLAKNYYYNKWIKTVTANAPSITFSANATISTSPLIAQSITIASGVTVTCGTHTCFFVAQSFNNYGTVVSPYGAPGGTAPTGAGAGGTGGGGIVVISITAVLGTLNVNGGNGITAVDYKSATGTGGYGMAGAFYVTAGVAVPSGGSGIGGGQNNGGPNGGGGGEGYSYDGAPGGGSTDYSFSNPNAMITYILQGIGDWWLANVVGKVPSTTTQLAFMYGSGGGGGSEASGYASGGGGGGGGGEVVIYGYNILSGTINAAGGAGGTGVGGYGFTGGGGGGGLAFVLYGATSGSITANVAGGPGYTAGTNGTAYIAAVTVNG